MKINKALVKHETRNMKWMLLYFLLISVSGILFFNSGLGRQYMEVLNGGLATDQSVMMSTVNGALNNMMMPIGFGILLMVYLQFKDSKSIEVGKFLKSLPISNKEFYITKLIGGLISLTIPTVLLILGILLIRNNNMVWISDIHSISLFPELVIKADSIINVTSVVIMSYLVAVSTYVFLFMMQYIVMNIVGGLVIGTLAWLSPMFIINSIFALYGIFFSENYVFSESIIKWQEILLNYVQPWSYPTYLAYFNSPSVREYNPILDSISFMYYEGLALKITITLIIALASIVLGYILSKNSKAEDSEMLISLKWARIVFIIGVTICSAVLLANIAQMFFVEFSSLGSFNSLNFIISTSSDK